MEAVIITIGDEILIGQIVDTNSAYIAEQLNRLGIRVHEMLSISDDKNHIINILNNVVREGRVVVITGGLGPTNDDITKKVLGEYTRATKMVTHEEQLAAIIEMTSYRKMMNELNRRQADVPDTCEVLVNRRGTAPGMWFDYKGALLIALPGVPFEMQHLMEEVVCKLQCHFKLAPIYHRSLMTFGLPESVLAERLASWESALPAYMKLAYLPNPVTGVQLRLSVYDELSNMQLQEVENQVIMLKKLLNNALYGEQLDNLQTVAGRLLQAKGATLATAESCTGGTVASLITSISGSSAYFKGGIVAYDNSVKINLLKVPTETLTLNGAVSREVVQAMAEGARAIMQSDYALATSGIAGPDGGTPDKPVGTVWIALAGPKGIKTELLNITGDRRRIIERTAANALNLLRLELLEA
ncbi:MAG: CinA family nicotinamide mononucleotide deamidase-related protein [Bacteroidales bacterium]|nr:CinA family nicotinamide mononucleotide deamidase-related protein [Bacteroidales bacterium]